MHPPSKLKSKYDGNELELQSTTKGKKEIEFTYRYTLSETKMNTTLVLGESDLIKFLSNGIFKEIA